MVSWFPVARKRVKLWLPTAPFRLGFMWVTFYTSKNCGHLIDFRSRVDNKEKLSSLFISRETPPSGRRGNFNLKWKLTGF